jgi:hypothetical protein
MVPVDPNVTAEAAVPLPAGTRLHDHVIETCLRAVPDGYVYRVVQTQTGAVAALHEYLPAAWAFRDTEGVLAKPGRGREFQVGLRRFLLRARQLRELEHPSLPRLIEAWPSHGTACILTAPAAERTLSDVVTSAGGRLPLDQAWPWLCACCDLAEWLHQQGKIHGAWDPETIGVTEDNRLILPMPEVDGPAHPASPWMPLEQTALAPKGVQRGPWTDVFGISGLAAYMLTGQSPALARRQPTAPVINTTPRASRTSASADTLPRAMMAAIRVSLLPNARQRPQDIAQLKTMMGLFATAPVLNEELKTAEAAQELRELAAPAQMVLPAQSVMEARPGRALDESLSVSRTAASPMPTSGGFGELPTEPMPLVSTESAEAWPSATTRLAAAGEHTAHSATVSRPAEPQQVDRELAAWNGEEPLPPDPAIRRRLSVGAGAVGAALVAAALVWVVVVDRPAPVDRSIATKGPSDPLRDADRTLSHAPPAAGTPRVQEPTQAPAGPAEVAAQAEAPRQAEVAAPARAERPTVAVAAPSTAANEKPRRSTSPVAGDAPAKKAAASEKPASQQANRTAGNAAPSAAAEATSRATPASRTPSCSQLLLEQSLGATVSPADLRNCR